MVLKLNFQWSLIYNDTITQSFTLSCHLWKVSQQNPLKHEEGKASDLPAAVKSGTNTSE